MRRPTNKTLGYFMAANFQALGLFMLAYLSGGWLNKHNPLEFGEGWYLVTFAVALVVIASMYTILMRAAWRIEKRLTAEANRQAAVHAASMAFKPVSPGDHAKTINDSDDEFDRLYEKLKDHLLNREEEAEDVNVPDAEEVTNDPLKKLVNELVERELKDVLRTGKDKSL